LIRQLPPENGGHLLYGGNNARNFYEPVSISDSLKLKWELSTHGSYNNSSVVLYDRYMITHDLSGTICCFNIETGKEVGSIKYNGAIYSVPVIYKSRMFFIVNKCEEKYATAYYYDLEDAKILAETNIQGSFSTQLLKNDNAFYAISDNGEIYKFNFAGVNEWKYETGVKVLATPAMYNEKIVFASTTGEVIIFDYLKKNIICRKKLGEGFYGGVAISGTTAYAGDSNGELYCFSIENGTLVWKTDLKNKITALPVHNEKEIFVTCSSGLICCLNKADGSVKWKTKINGAPLSTPLLFKNYLLQPNMDSYLYFINPADGKVVKKKKFSGRMKMTPVLYNNLLILGYDKGNIDVFEITEVK
jgi:outer membrane protein assembly factor BamB